MAKLSEKQLQFLENPYVGVVTTLREDGSPHSTVVWVDVEDGVPQQIINFGQTQAPITAVLLVEFSNSNYAFMTDALRASYAFANSLQKDDYVAIIEYDMKPNILLDFTQDKNAVYGALNMLRIPGFSESNLFDALVDTLDGFARFVQQALHKCLHGADVHRRD